MKSMTRFLLHLLLMPLAGSAWSAEAAPSVLVVRSLSPDHASRIELTPVPDSVDYLLSYTVRSKGENLKSDKKISESAAKSLTDILAQGNQPYSKWTSDPTCGPKNLWHVKVDADKKTVCRNSDELKTLQSFLAAVVSLTQ
jgi:hypothetical protein